MTVAVKINAWLALGVRVGEAIGLGRRAADLRPSVTRLKATLLAALIGMTCGSPSFAQGPTEHQVKAAFVFNFTKFVEWPAPAFRSSPNTINICLIGEDLFGKVLDETVKGQIVGGRGFAVRRLTQIPRDDSCQVAFLGGMDKRSAEQILAPIKSLPILTVVDNEDSGDPGAMIGFVVDDNKVRFNVNLDIAERAGVKLSSKLLKLAKQVRERGGK